MDSVVIMGIAAAGTAAQEPASRTEVGDLAIGLPVSMLTGHSVCLQR